MLMKNENNNFNEVLTSSTDDKEPINNKEDNNVANNFPDWDLLPPYQTVRRINRK